MSSVLPVPVPSPPKAAILPWCLFLGCLAYCIFAASRGWHRSLLEDQPFRQTQTAISAYYMIGQPPRLAYETPVLGAPWSVPFEFPLYQWLVALLVTLGHTALDPTGRLVSLLFFLFSLIPAYWLLDNMGLSRENRLLVLALLLVNPFYVYWSRSFLIESTAFCFGMAYLACGVAFLKAPGKWTALGALMTGILGALVKITTFTAFFLGVCLVWVYLMLKAYRTGRTWSELGRAGLLFLLITVPPVAVLAWWNDFTDLHRDANYIGHFLTSRALKTWVFGTLEERFTGATWKRFYQWYHPALGHMACLGICLPALAFAGRRREILVCLFLGLSTPLIYTSLYFHHEYYLYANLAFFVAAVAFSLIALRERGGVYRLASHGLLVLVIGLSLYRYYHTFYPKQMEHFFTQRFAPVCQGVQKVSQPDEVILVIGCDWDPTIPYYSRRRALMIPNWLAGDFVNHMPAYWRHLTDCRVGALVVYDDPAARLPPQALQRILQEFHLSPDCLRIHDNWFRIYSVRHEGLTSPER